MGDDEWSADERQSLAALIEIEPDLSEIVDDRKARLQVWKWVRRITSGATDFFKWAAALAGLYALAKTFLHGWLK